MYDNVINRITFRQIQQILDDKSQPAEGEERLAALTAGERTEWAKAREEFFSKGVNKASLDLIEKSAFVVALDDVPYIYDPVSDIKIDLNYILMHTDRLSSLYVERRNSQIN